jgi:hypothetical protein
MALSEFEKERFSRIASRYVESKRPPTHIRPELDFGFRLTGQSLEIFEVRPAWRGKPGETIENPVVKTTFVKSQGIWKIYWQRADLKWHRYGPNESADTLEGVLAVVERDEYGCFYG